MISRLNFREKLVKPGSVDVMTADDLYNDKSLSLVLLTFEDDYYRR